MKKLTNGTIECIVVHGILNLTNGHVLNGFHSASLSKYIISFEIVFSAFLSIIMDGKSHPKTLKNKQI